MKTISDIQFVWLPCIREANGTLVPLEGGVEVPFEIRRAFYVLAPTPVGRGQHAHRECAQFLTCLNGVVEVICDDGRDRATYKLDRLDRGLYVPPTIWAKQNYQEDRTVMSVLCDRPYDEGDYIRDYQDFLRWRNAAEQ